MTDAGANRQLKPDWVSQLADRVIRRFEKQNPTPGQKLVCASGLSPSGPIHLGNLRELMVPHYVAEEIRSRGVDCEHLLSWDDYDRLRLAHALPDGSRDMLVDKGFALENGLDALNGVDFDKGCYVGQELTARTKHRGAIRKRIFRVDVDGPLPEPGAPVTLGGRDAGEMRSARDRVGLALLRVKLVDHGEESRLQIRKPLRARW